MWHKTALVMTFVLLAAAAGAQSLPAPPRPPALPKAPALPVAPAIAPDLASTLEGLDLDLAGLAVLKGEAMAMALDAASMSLGAVGHAFDVDPMDLVGLQDAAALKRQALTFASEDMEYDRGTSSLDSGRYDRAVEAFDKVIARGGKKAEGALYWKAYALNRLGRRDEATRTIEDLLKKYPSSRWANDARALLIDVRQASGQPVSPEKAGDEDLKLIALNGIMARDPDRAIPMVEQLLAGSASPRLKERALFVLAQSASPRARTLLAEVAKGKGNPDLQLKALDYLGVFGNGPDVSLLVDIYKTTGDTDVKRRVIRSLAVAGRRGAAFPFAFGDFPMINGEVMAQVTGALDSARVEMERNQAISEAERARVKAELDRARSDMTRQESGTARAARPAVATEREKAREAKAKEATDALWQLYQGETSPDLKREILRNMRFATQADRLLQIAKTDPSPDLRRAAIQGLVLGHAQNATETLLGLYRGEKDPEVRRQIIDSFPAGTSAAALVQMARQETDPQLRKRIVERLSRMKDKEAVDYMMEILKK
jgi:tetratricopeptide (TPR) repeat protein